MSMNAPNRWEGFTEAERNYLRGALESFDAPPELNGVPDLEAELAELDTTTTEEGTSK